MIQTRGTGQIRSDISHDDISDSDQSDQGPVRVLQSLTRVTGDLIMIIIISAIITPNDTHPHPPHTITGFIWQHSPQDNMSQSPVSAPGTTLVTSNNGLIMPGPWVATGNINNTHHEPRDMMETFLSHIGASLIRRSDVAGATGLCFGNGSKIIFTIFGRIHEHPEASQSNTV